MLYRDIDKKLDMWFGISIEFKHKLIALLLKEVDVIPVYLHHSGEVFHMDLFIHASEVSRLLGVIAQYKPVKIGNYLIVRLHGRELLGITEPSRRLLEVTSSIPGDLFIQDGRFYTYARFHSSELEKVSQIISDSLRANPKTKLEILGKSPGGIRILQNIDRRIALAVVSFDFPISSSMREDVAVPHYAELNIELLMSEKYRVIFYPSSPYTPTGKSVRISTEPEIYATAGTVDMLKDLYIACNEMQIPIVASVTKSDGKKLRVSEFIPIAMKDEFIETLFEVSARYPEAGLSLSQISVTDSDLWEWL